MSTKIYTGFQFKSNNIVTINKNIQKFRFKLDNVIKSKYNGFIANIATHKLDLITCKINDENDKESPYVHAFKVLEKLIRENNLPENKYLRNFLDYSTSITIHTYKNNFYGILFTGDNEINKLWFKQKYIKDFSYWNNTDKLDNVSEKEWNKRSQIWEELLKDFNYIPSLNGFTAELTKEMFYYLPFDPNDILPYIPSYEKRIENIIQKYIFKKFDIKYDSNFYIWKNINKRLYQKYYNKFDKMLIKNISKEMLIEKISKTTNKKNKRKSR